MNIFIKNYFEKLVRENFRFGRMRPSSHALRSV